MDRDYLLHSKLAAIKEGDHEAFIEVYHALHVKVFRFLVKRVYQHDAAKDLTQQCFIRLWQFRHTLSPDHALEKQVFIIARSILINHIKKEATQKKLKANHMAVVEKDIQEPAIDDRLELSSEVSAAIESLSPVRRKIIILKALHGCSNKEIALQLKISVKTVEDHITKAFRHIRQVVAVLILVLLMHS